MPPVSTATMTVTAAIETVARAARNAGKHWAATCGSLDAARKMIDLGASLLFHGCDIVFVKHGFDQVQAAFGKELGFRFGRDSAPAGKSYLGHRQ
jgi:4-hydroxy-2-oxoheptanedioate aldolase